MITESKSGSQAGLIRVGGAALLVAFAIHIFANAFLKQFPPTDPTLSELTTYLEAEASTWKIVHGMRYVAVAFLALFLGGIIARIRSDRFSNSGGWEYVGLVGGILHVANLFIVNGIETFAFIDFELLSGRPELFWLVFHSTRVLFTAEVVAWAILIFGFSMAGWLSGSIPKLIAIIGFTATALAMLSGVSVGVVMTTGGWIESVFEIGAVMSLVWFLSTGVWMLWRGDS